MTRGMAAAGAVVMGWLMLTAGPVAQSGRAAAPQSGRAAANAAKQAKAEKAAAEKRQKEAAAWVAATMKRMTLDEKVGQLLFPSINAAFLSTDTEEFEKLRTLVRDLQVGGAQVSTKHAGFVVNATGTATAADVRGLIHEVQQRVYKKHGVMLHPEVRIIGEA